ncbi:MAG: HNH endonuclease [Selenomonadaceae bacterium]|nr:HNH endonuclease [Selenomonadaceae bacterium]
MSDLEKISEIIQKMKDPNSSNWCLELQQALDIIWNSPSDHWRSAAIVYYIVHSGEIDFEPKYLKFLHKLIATLTRIHAVTGTALSIRFPVLELNIQSIKSDHPNFPANDFTDQDVDNAIRQNGLITRTILRIIAYSDPDQKTILPSKLPLAWEIEHILPQNFQQNYAPKDPAIINAIGNLTPLEKSLNISAKNKSFNDKTGWYQTSSISMTKKIGSLDSWDANAISNRSDEMINQILDLFKKWDSEY